METLDKQTTLMQEAKTARGAVLAYYRAYTCHELAHELGIIPRSVMVSNVTQLFQEIVEILRNKFSLDTMQQMPVLWPEAMAEAL